jgi:hypothetical protein
LAGIGIATALVLFVGAMGGCALLYKAGNMVETDINGDPHYRVVVDYKQHPPVESA